MRGSAGSRSAVRLIGVLPGIVPNNRGPHLANRSTWTIALTASLTSDATSTFRRSPLPLHRRSPVLKGACGMAGALYHLRCVPALNPRFSSIILMPRSPGGTRTARRHGPGARPPSSQRAAGQTRPPGLSCCPSRTRQTRPAHSGGQMEPWCGDGDGRPGKRARCARREPLVFTHQHPQLRMESADLPRPPPVQPEALGRDEFHSARPRRAGASPKDGGNPRVQAEELPQPRC